MKTFRAVGAAVAAMQFAGQAIAAMAAPTGPPNLRTTAQTGP